MTRIRHSSRVTLALFALIGLATCGGDGGGSSPSTPAPPAPAPTPLSFLDIPTEPIRVLVGKPLTLRMRLSAGISAEVTATTDEKVTVTGTVQGGVVTLILEGLQAGESRVDLTAEPNGYTRAEASFSVVVRELGLVEAETFAFADWNDWKFVLELVADERISEEDTVARIVLYLIARGPENWGRFDERAVVEWEGEEELIETTFDDVPVIRVWGLALHPDDDGSHHPLGWWWILKVETTFSSLERATSAERFLGVGEDSRLNQEEILRRLRQ